MKYKLKTRLFAALALSGASFYWPASAVLAQEDDFGFIRPAEPTRHDQELSVAQVAKAAPPIVREASSQQQPIDFGAVRPPVALSPVTPTPSNRKAGVSPVPFASSSVFNGAYVESGPASVGHAQHVTPIQDTQQPNAQHVAYHNPSSGNQSQFGSGIHAKRDLPPIVESPEARTRSAIPQIIQPFEQSELPPILLSVREASDSSLPPVVTPKKGLNQLLGSVPAVGAGRGMVQQEFLMNADGSSVDQTSKVEPAAFGNSPVLVQDAPPIIGGSVDSLVPGALPSTDGLLTPIDPATQLPPAVEPFPRELPSGSSTRSTGSSTRSTGSSTRSTGSSTRSPGGSSTRAPGSVVDGGIPIQPGQGTFFDPSGQPVAGGCSTCGAAGGSCGCNGSAVGGCSSCGDGGCFDPEAIENLFNTSGANAYARRYAIAEVLYFDRADGDIDNSNFGQLNNFDFSAGWRFTLGQREDSTRGREFQYTGTSPIDQTLQVFTDGGTAQSEFVPFGGFTGGDVAAFFNATEQTQTKETFFHSLEFNRVKWGWDVIKSFVGFRYIFVDDEYTLFSQSGGLVPAVNGSFQQAATNNLIGPHIGGELYYDVGYRWSLSGFSKAGIYANFNRFDTNLVNDDVELINAEDTNFTISTSYEVGLNAKYRLTQQAQFRVGYNLFFIGNLGTVSDNLVNVGGIGLSPDLGAETTDSDDVFFHGLSFGLEVYR